jgi:hypothetical protein
MVQRNHLFCKTNAQKTVAKVNNLRTEEKPPFVYLRIRVSGQRNHSLNTRKNEEKKAEPHMCLKNSSLQKMISSVDGSGDIIF